MGIIVNKENDNDELSKRINADLRAKMQAEREDPDLVEDSDFGEELKKTNRFGWIWIVLIVLALISLIFIVFF